MVPDWLGILLLILTCASFLPQLHRLWARKDASGISLSYVLLNLITATEQFALTFGFVVLDISDDGVFVHHPLTLGDQLNLSQTIVFCVLFLIYFILCLWYPSESSRSHKRQMTALYIIYLLMAVLPLLIFAIILRGGEEKDSWDELPAMLAFVPHSLYLSYIATIAAIIAVYRQARVILSSSPGESCPLPTEAAPSHSHGVDSSLSLPSLAIHAIVFILLAISWIFRVSFPPLPDGADWWSFYVLRLWYEWVGSIAVDNAIFGIGQGILFYLAVRWGRKEAVSSPEREPLLR